MEIDIQQAAKVAKEAVADAISYLDTRFETLLEKNIAEVGCDVTTDADVAAEGIIREILTKHFPDVSLYGEELESQVKSSEYGFHIDPLDGTNNYAYAIPLYGSCVALTKNNVPILGVIGQGQVQSIYSSADKNPNKVSRIEDLSKSVFGMSIGYLHGTEREDALAFREFLVRNTGRVLSTWAPTADWVSFAKGGLHAMIVYNDYGPEIASGVACALASGATVRKYNGDEFTELDIDEKGELIPTKLVCAHPDSIDEVLELVNRWR